MMRISDKQDQKLDLPNKRRRSCMSIDVSKQDAAASIIDLNIEKPVMIDLK